MNDPLVFYLLLGKCPPFEIIMGHMPHRLRPMPPPPPENIMGHLAPFFQFINRALNM